MECELPCGSHFSHRSLVMFAGWAVQALDNAMLWFCFISPTPAFPWALHTAGRVGSGSFMAQCAWNSPRDLPGAVLLLGSAPALKPSHRSRWTNSQGPAGSKGCGSPVPSPEGNHGEKHLENGMSLALGRAVLRVLGAALTHLCVPLCRSRRRRSRAGAGPMPQGPGCIWSLISEPGAVRN